MAIEGDHVLLRPLAPADAPALAALLADPDARAALALDRAPTPEEAAALVDALAAADRAVVLGIALRDGGRLVGVCGLDGVRRPDGGCELGIALADPAARGRGLGGEAIRLLVAHAFGALGRARVTLRVAPGDARAVRAYARAGFRRSGAAADPDAPLVEMAIAREDWAAAGGESR